MSISAKLQADVLRVRIKISSAKAKMVQASPTSNLFSKVLIGTKQNINPRHDPCGPPTLMQYSSDSKESIYSTEKNKKNSKGLKEHSIQPIYGAWLNSSIRKTLMKMFLISNVIRLVYRWPSLNRKCYPPPHEMHPLYLGNDVNHITCYRAHHLSPSSLTSKLSIFCLRPSQSQEERISFRKKSRKQ